MSGKAFYWLVSVIAAGLVIMASYMVVGTKNMPIDSKATAYVCENYVCKRPANKIDSLDKILSDITRVKEAVAV